MRGSRQGVKPADPQLEAGRPAQALRPFGIPRWAGAGLYVLFSFVLLLPLVRRWRRESWWTGVRAALLLLGIAGVAAWAAGGAGAPAGAAGAISLICGLWLGRLTDPDYERKLQRRHGAEYLLNGGVHVDGRLSNSEPLSGAEELYLLIRRPHLLVVPKKGAGEVHSAFDIRKIERIAVDGETYVPTYVSEAKDPPVREKAVDRNASSDLELAMEDGTAVRFRYRGAFHKHLAETAAHGIYSVRASLRTAGSPVEMPILNRPGA